MAYKVIILYQLYMPSYFLGTFTEYPKLSMNLLAFFLVIPLRFERKTHALEGLQVQSLFITDLQAIITHVKKNADKPFDKP